MTIYLWEFPDCKGALELEFDFTFGNALNAKVHLILNVTIPLGMP